MVSRTQDSLNQYISELGEFSENEKNTLKKSINLLSNKDCTHLESILNTQALPQQKEEKIIFKSPENDTQILINLKEIINHYPRYLLGNDLAVLKKKNLHHNTDAAEIYKQLIAKKNDIIKELRLVNESNSPEIYSPELIAIKLATLLKINIVIDMYKPKKIVPVAIMIENKVNKGASDVFIEATSNSIQSKTPVIITKTIVYNQTKEFQKLLESQDIYVQKNGGFILVLPQGSNPKELGFNTEENFIKWTEPLKNIPITPLNFSEDINALFLPEQEDCEFNRVISLNGHGISPTEENSLNESQITGLSVPEFQKGLKTLQDNGMIFLHLFSCYLGGINSTKLHTLEGTIPCPILVESSIDIPAYSSKAHYGEMFTKVEKLLLKENLDNKKMPKQIHPLSRKDMMDIAKSTPLHLTEDKGHYLDSLSTTIFPTSLEDVPKVRYTLPTLGLIFNVNNELKEMQKNGLDKDKIKVPPEQSTLFFSAPVIENSIVVDSPKLILTAGGGNSQHLIKELDAPNLEILDIAKSTFEILSNAEFPTPAKKAYFFGSVKCKYKGELVEIQDCMIKKTPQECLLLFKIKGNDNHVAVRYISENNFYDDLVNYKPIDNDIKLTSEEMDLLVYDTLSETAPSELTLKQSGTTAFNKNMLSEFDNLFWQDKKQSSVTDISSLDWKIYTLKTRISVLTQELSLEKVLDFAKRYPLIAKYVHDKWHNNSEFLLGLCPHDPNILQIATPETILKLLGTLPGDPPLLKYLSQSAKANEDLVLALIKLNPGNCAHFTPENRANPKIILALLPMYPDYFGYVDGKLKNDENFLIECLKVAPKTFKHMSEEARSNPTLIEIATKENKEMEEYVGVNVKNKF